MSSPSKPTIVFTPIDELPGEEFREKLRQEHGVRLVTDDENGSGVHRLPAGVFGYTYSPGFHDTPLFQTRGLNTFEVFKDREGAVSITGFTTAESVRRFRAGEEFDLRLFPMLSGEHQELIAIPEARTSKVKMHSQREDGGLTVVVRPAR